MSTTYTSREFNQDSSGAKKAAKKGPVFITDRGRPSHVLMVMSDFERLAGSLSLLDAIAQVESDADFDFEPKKIKGSMHKIPDL